MCRIGVVVTVFNQEKFIEHCLNSILQQTYKEIELVVVDDGSTDASGAICDRVARGDSRITVLHQQNQGPIIARLHGVELVTAEYVTFVDGDDWLDEMLYQDMVAKNVLGQADIVAYGMIRYREEQDMYQEPCIFEEGIYSKEEINNKIIPKLFWDFDKCTYGLDPSLCSKFFRREQLEKHLRNIRTLNIHYGEDIALLYPLFLECDSIIVIGKCYYYHRIRKNNILPPYYKDEQYYHKLYILYRHLFDVFSSSEFREPLLKQLDYFYMYSIRLGKIKYGDLVFEERYMFPFDKVDKNSRLVIYGAGQVGQTFYSQLKRLQYCNAAGWVDRDYKLYRKDGVQGIESIQNMEYDYILVAVYGKEVAVGIRMNLMKMGIDAAKIITL